MSEAAKPTPAASKKGRKLGRFEMFGSIASGGFASVHLGRTLGAGGFSKLVAVKRLHRQFAEDPEIAKMFLDEARVVARIQHPNVVPTLDFVEEDSELFMVMEYVEGATLGNLLHLVRKKKQRLPLDITLRIMTGALRGLHAAHEATNERGAKMHVIHRDVSPENILVGTDGFSRILDFGVARALGRYQATRQGEVKGKVPYMTPEQVAGGAPLTCRTDIFSLSVVFWECLTNKRLFEGEHMAEIAAKVSQQAIASPSVHYRTLPRKYEAIVMRGLERDPDKRWPTAEAMAEAIEDVGKLASPGRVGKWVKTVAKDLMARRSEQISSVELTPTGDAIPEPAASEGENSYRAATTHVLKMEKQETDSLASKVIVADDLPPTSSLRGVGSDPGSETEISEPGARLGDAETSEPNKRTAKTIPPVSQRSPQPFAPSPSHPDSDSSPEVSWPGDDADVEPTLQSSKRDGATEVMVAPEIAALAADSPPLPPIPPPPTAKPSQDEAVSDEVSVPVVVAQPKRGPAVAIGIGIALLAGFGLVFMLQSGDEPASPAPATAPKPAAEPSPAATAEPEAASKPAMDVAEPDDEIEERPNAAASAESSAEEPPSAAPAPNPVAARQPTPPPRAAAPPAARPRPRSVPARPRPLPTPKPKPKASSPEDKLFSRD